MPINSHVNKLSDRVRHFFRVNKKVDFLSLKLHLECTGTDLLLALGGLINEQVVELERDGWKIIIQKKSYPPITSPQSTTKNSDSSL